MQNPRSVVFWDSCCPILLRTIEMPAYLHLSRYLCVCVVSCGLCAFPALHIFFILSQRLICFYVCVEGINFSVFNLSLYCGFFLCDGCGSCLRASKCPGLCIVTTAHRHATSANIGNRRQSDISHPSFHMIIVLETSEKQNIVRSMPTCFRTPREFILFHIPHFPAFYRHAFSCPPPSTITKTMFDLLTRIFFLRPQHGSGASVLLGAGPPGPVARPAPRTLRHRSFHSLYFCSEGVLGSVPEEGAGLGSPVLNPVRRWNPPR